MIKTGSIVLSELLDKKIDYYEFFWESRLNSFVGVPNASIQKKDGTEIGTICTGGWINRYATLLDKDNRIVVKSYKNKIHSYKYTIKDHNKNKIGVVSGTKFLTQSYNMTMKNESGEKILTIKGDQQPEGKFEINTTNGDTIAIGNFSYTKNMESVVSLKIIDSDFDRKRLWGMFISYTSGFSDTADIHM